MKTIQTLNNSTAVEIKYIAPTNHSGSRVQIKTYDLRHRNNDKACIKYIAFDYSESDINLMVLKHIEKFGKFKAIAANYNNPKHNVLLFKWNIEALAKVFNIKLIDEV